MLNTNIRNTYTSTDYNLVTGGLLLVAVIILSTLLTAVYHTVSFLISAP